MTPKEHPKYNGYLIYPDGRIYSLKSNKFLGYSYDRFGYQRVGLYLGKCKSKTIKVHRLVAEVFIPNDENKKDINHKDGNKTNNHVSNLEWLTRSENMKHAFSTGLKIITERHLKEFKERRKMYTGSKNHASRKVLNTENGIIYDTVSFAAESIGIPRQYLSYMLNGRKPNTTGMIFLSQVKTEIEKL